MFAGLLPERPVEDILAGRLRIVLGGRPYELPVLPRAANRRWKASIETRLGALLEAIDRTDDVPAILAALSAASDDLLELLVSYDEGGRLPPRDEIDETATDGEVLRAVLEVWQAANPLVGIALAGLRAPIAGTSPEPTSSPPPSGAGRPRRSRKA